MTKIRIIMICAAGTLALTACDDRDPGEREPVDDPVAEKAGAGAPPPQVALANDARAAEIRQDAPTAGGAAEAPIPAALHGRWGLTQRACAVPPGQAEGLLVVTGESLLFHEGRADPATNLQASAESVSGEFVFTGEGQTERRFQSLRRQGDQLVRTGNGPEATYVRCAS
jgi:hypothetical protein